MHTIYYTLYTVKIYNIILFLLSIKIYYLLYTSYAIKYILNMYKRKYMYNNNKK